MKLLKACVLKTQLTEEQLRERMERLCQPMSRRDKELVSCETFLYEEKNGKFRLGAHHSAKSKNPGRMADCICGRFSAESDGRMTVSYRFGKLPAFFIMYLVCLALGLALAVWTVMGIMDGKDAAGSCGGISLFFLIVSAIGFCGKASERKALESHLRYICEVDEAAEAMPADVEPGLSDMDEVFPLRLVFEGREYLTLYGYADDGETPRLLGGEGYLWCFRDSAQMERFCGERGIEIVGVAEILRFDEPISEVTSPDQILNRWNRLSLMAEALGRSFAGDSEAHAELYECLFNRTLSVDVATDGDALLEAEQVEELGQVFDGQAELFAGFTLWRE